MGLFDNDYKSQNNFHATTPQITTQDFAKAIQQSQGGFNQNQMDQATLAKALLAQSQGAGPNPALDQLHQTTDQNVAQANSLIASQRGLNPALAARAMARDTAEANQQATGQAAVMRANQQLSAEGALSGLYGQMGSQQIQNQGVLQGAQANQNNAINTGTLGTGQLNEQSAAQNNAINAAVAQSNSDRNASFWGGVINAGAGAAAHAATAMSTGGEVPGKASVPGDSLANDKVPAVLSPGEIVIPRSHAKDPESAKSFIDAIMASKGDDGAPGYAKVLRARKTHEERMADLSKFLGAKK